MVVGVVVKIVVVVVVLLGVVEHMCLMVGLLVVEYSSCARM